MSTRAPKLLFVDRDGTLIAEPADEQVDSYGKFRLLPGVISSLARFVDAGYALVMVSNQDGLGSETFPHADFDGPQQLLIDVLGSEGIRFREILIDPHRECDAVPTRKPGVGMVRHYLGAGAMDRERSLVIGDRDSDMEFAANMGIRGVKIGTDGDWPAIARRLLDDPRVAAVQRATRETRIEARVDLDRPGEPVLATGLAFFDHMLDQLGTHGGFALSLHCDGDLHVDEHHVVEDCAIVIGEAIARALGERRGIGRYGFLLPMDEARAQVALDLSGRAYFSFEGHFARDKVGDLSTELVPHFFRSFAQALGAALHLQVTGENAHHMVEACFKAVGRALRQAIRRDGMGVPSSKGVL